MGPFENVLQAGDSPKPSRSLRNLQKPILQDGVALTARNFGRFVRLADVEFLYTKLEYYHRTSAQLIDI